MKPKFKISVTASRPDGAANAQFKAADANAWFGQTYMRGRPGSPAAASVFATLTWDALDAAGWLHRDK